VLGTSLTGNIQSAIKRGSSAKISDGNYWEALNKMFAVIETGGKQYKVHEGLIVDIEKLDAEANANVTFDKVLMVFDGKESKIGAPFLEGAKVAATILEQHRDDKVTTFKLKNKTGYKRTKGHRQHLTRVKITAIS